MGVEHILSEAMVNAAQDMDEAEKRIVAARKRLATANRKYLDYQRGAARRPILSDKPDA